ncbi:OmpA family protein [Maribacter sp. 2307ULW6-5]|uniref:OmpA family protein n=1 Tax=Maribacter sp. 2307ULW6-5 TaxID=3386275 RepID=UPI0039BD0891
MKTSNWMLSLFLCLFVGHTSMAQLTEEELQLTAKDSIVQSSWILGLGLNAVDDSGNVLDGLFNVGNEWNMVPFPSRLSIGRYFKSGLGLEAVGTYNQYQEGKIIDGLVNPQDIDYFGIDARITYDLNKIVGQTGWFDPYVGVGAGYTEANNLGRGTYNAVVGFRTWFSDRWGLDFNSTGKWAMSQSNGATNHVQHAAGVVYQFGIEKGLSKRGEEKKALLAALEQERQRQQDSINEANRLREEALLAERLKKEQEEAAALAAAEQARKDALAQRFKELQTAMDDLGDVQFKFNSSYLTATYKSILDEIAVLLQENPDIRVKVTAHTDSRGSDAYNLWLSERRLERTLDYLKSKNLSGDRILGEAKGERQLKNECADGVPCSETKHGVNRRSTFSIALFGEQ